MDSELERAYNLITRAVRAEDVFGDLIDPRHRTPREQMLDLAYQGLIGVLDPGRYPGNASDAELAGEARARLIYFHERARMRLADNLYGARQQLPSLKKSDHVAFATDQREYYLGSPLARGTFATVFRGECALGDEQAASVAIKIVDDPRDNDLLLREMRVLKLLHSKAAAQRKHLPVLLDHFQTEDRRAGLVLRYLEESFDLFAVRDRPQYRGGVDRKHAVWMLSRMLSAAGYAHSLGVVHGNLEPAHLFVRPRDHNLFVIDWAWAAVDPAHTGDPFRIATDDYSAPEVRRRESPTPAADLYSIGKCVIFALGGDLRTDRMPDTVEEELQRLIRYLVLESPLQRAQDAWQTWRILNNLVCELWGPKKFIEFPM